MILNNEQAQVVNTLDRNILLTASAGTGKTSTLAARIRNILSTTDTKPSEVLCLTYTNRACNEMITKVRAYISKDQVADLTVKTIHSFCLGIINEHPELIQMGGRKFEVIEESSCLDRFANLLSDKIPWNSSFGSYHSAAKQFYVYFNYMMTQRIKSNTLEQAHRIVMMHDSMTYSDIQKSNRNSDFIDVIEEYGVDLAYIAVRELLKAGLMTYDMVITFSRFVLISKQGYQIYSKRFKYIMIDEMQDLSTSMFNILCEVFRKSNMMLCGDCYQTIYGWRGSDPDRIISKFRDERNPVEITLIRNYRSTLGLQKLNLNIVNTFLRNRNSIPLKIEEDNREFTKDAWVVVSDSMDAEIRYICDEIEAIKKEDPRASIAILTRTNKYATELVTRGNMIAKMIQSDIKFGSARDYAKIKAPIFEIIGDILKCYTGAFGEDALKGVLFKLGVLNENNIELLRKLRTSAPQFSITDGVDFTWRNRYSKSPFDEIIHPDKEKFFIIVDTETTGRDLISDDVIQLAAVKLNSDFEVVDQFDSIIYTNHDLGESEKVHNISRTVIEECGRDREEVLREFLQFCGDDNYIVGHNINFDLCMINRELAKIPALKGQWKYNRIFDTMVIAKRVVQSVKSHTLEVLCGLFDVGHRSTHNAYDDVLATREVLITLREKYLMPMEGRDVYFWEKLAPKVNSIFAELSQINADIEKLSCQEVCSELYDLILPLTQVQSYDESGMQLSEEGLQIKKEFLSLVSGCVKDAEFNDCFSTRSQLLNVIEVFKKSKSELDYVLRMFDKIPILTVHNSKGCEYDYVFATEMYERNYCTDTKYSIHENFMRQEPRRLFYVAATRPKTRLYLMAAEIRNDKLTSMISKLDQNLIRYVTNMY